MCYSRAYTNEPLCTEPASLSQQNESKRADTRSCHRNTQKWDLRYGSFVSWLAISQQAIKTLLLVKGGVSLATRML